MRLSTLRLHWVRIPFHEPFRISSGEVSLKDAILIELEGQSQHAAARVTGWGEASPMAGAFYSSETPQSTWDFLCQRLVPLMLTMPERSPEDFAAWLTEITGEPFAKAGVEGALWDLHCREISKPLCDLLGSKSRPIPSGAAIGLMPTLNDLLDRVEKFLRAGYRRIKIKIAPGNDVELVRGVRQHFGDIPLMVDANAAYHLKDASVFEELDPLGLMMIEQPLAREAIAEHAELQARLRTSLCLDESADSLKSISEIIQLGSARILNIKVQRMGGLWLAGQAHDAAKVVGIPCWLGAMPELGIASAQSLHLGTLPNFVFPSDVEASLRWYADDIITPLIEISPNGYIYLPDGPGMGYQVDAAKVARYRIRMEEFRA
ncbi:MAG TPA: o-succinylbenzoate synthase [Terriglobia bacterium]|nr:o-succinylbenzoate synthase [Terriglobia bacterium]